MFSDCRGPDPRSRPGLWRGRPQRSTLTSCQRALRQANLCWWSTRQLRSQWNCPGRRPPPSTSFLPVTKIRRIQQLILTSAKDYWTQVGPTRLAPLVVERHDSATEINKEKPPQECRDVQTGKQEHWGSDPAQAKRAVHQKSPVIYGRWNCAGLVF